MKSERERVLFYLVESSDNNDKIPRLVEVTVEGGEASSIFYYAKKGGIFESTGGNAHSFLMQSSGRDLKYILAPDGSRYRRIRPKPATEEEQERYGQFAEECAVAATSDEEARVSFLKRFKSEFLGGTYEQEIPFLSLDPDEWRRLREMRNAYTVRNLIRLSRAKL